MGKIASDETKEVPVERWAEWCDLFTDGNRGRLIGIETVDAELGAQSLADGVVLVAIDYDSEGKGNDFVLSYGKEQSPSRHVVSKPVALWQAQDRNGRVVSLEIEDDREGRTIVRLRWLTKDRPQHVFEEAGQANRDLGLDVCCLDYEHGDGY